MTEATIKFNVGGKLFEVSRSLIDDGYSDTVLGKLVSDTWADANDPSKPVFIDRDGDIFAHILNYLRYGSIDLPITIRRSMFCRELDYYGIMSAGGITDQESLAKIMNHSFAAPMAEAQKKIDIVKESSNAFLLAVECYGQYCQHKAKNPNASSVSVNIGSQHNLYNPVYSNHEERAVYCPSINIYLERYFGLTARAGNYIYDGYMFIVCVTSDK